jgi:hypothetical protein
MKKPAKKKSGQTTHRMPKKGPRVKNPPDKPRNPWKKKTKKK